MIKYLNTSFIALSASSILTLAILIYILRNKKNNSQINKLFSYTLICILIISIGVILQSIFSNLFTIDPIHFEKFIYIGTCFLPVFLYLTSIAFSNTKINFNKWYLLLFVIPIISLIVLCTNSLHHLFYKTYSMNTAEVVFGPYFYVHTLYTYGLLLLSLIGFLKYSIKNSGFFSKQSILITIGSLVPIVANILGTFNIIHMTVYMTPMCFSITIMFYAIAIFKFNFLSVAPIALQRIVDRMSDAYIVIDEENNIIDFNSTFIKKFKVKNNSLRGKNIFDIIKLNNGELSDKLEKSKTTTNTISFEKYIPSLNKYFNIEISSITNKGTFLGTLILFKDITQHIQDMNTIQNKQDQLIEQERLASLGQMIGGIAHNLKTPIMSISGAAEGIRDLVNEFDASIGNPVVNNDDFHAIASDMYGWIDKIKSYTEYMSDVITAVKGQAVVLGNDTEIKFTISELLKRVNILMRHELKNAVVYLNTVVKIDENTYINGDVNSLVQVINNMISNAIQAYNGEPEKNIDLIVDLYDNNHVVLSVKDYGPGLPDIVKDKLFKEMITTKGKNGTGLGLYMSYSTIKAHFNGNVTVESEKGKGTTFNIILPL